LLVVAVETLALLEMVVLAVLAVEVLAEVPAQLQIPVVDKIKVVELQV
jgi:hypothetical protein